MGYNDWLHGNIAIPSAETAAMRKTLNAAHEARRVEVEKHAARLWGMIKSVPVAKRVAWLGDPANYYGSLFADETRWSTWSAQWWGARRHNDDVRTALHLFRLSGGRKPTAADYEAAGLAPANNRRREWREGTLTVRLTNRTLEVEVSDGRNSVEYADKTRLGSAMFGHLDRVRWTARSGGVLEGGDDGGDYPATYVVRRYESAADRARRIKTETDFAQAMYL